MHSRWSSITYRSEATSTIGTRGVIHSLHRYMCATSHQAKVVNLAAERNSMDLADLNTNLSGPYAGVYASWESTPAPGVDIALDFYNS